MGSMTMGMYKAKVRWYSAEEHEEKTDYLAVYGHNYEDVAHHLEEYYGGDVINMKIEQVNDCNLIWVPKEVYKTMEPTF